MPAVLHLVPSYRRHVRAHALGGVTTAALALSQLAPDHRLVTAVDLPHLEDLERPERAGLAPLIHLHHALAWEAVAPLSGYVSIVKTIHVLQRRQNQLRQAPETKSSAAQAEVLRRADRLSVATRAARDMLLEDHPELGDLGDRLVTLPLIPPALAPRPPRGEGPPLVVAVTRFDTLKGTDLLVEVLASLLRARPGLHVALAGGLPDHPKYERRWLATLREAILDAAGVDGLERFAFLGWLDPRDVSALLTRADLLIAPSRLETCGLTVLEGLAHATPIVATDIPAHREVAGDAALLVPPRADALTGAALGLVDHPERATALGARGPARIPSREAVVAQWLHFWAQTR